VAESHGWGAPATIAALAAAVALLVSFAAVERRVEHPLLPLRVVADRARAGGMLLSATALIMFTGVSVDSSAAGTYAATHVAAADVAAQAAVQGDTTGLRVGRRVFTVGTVMSWLLLPSGATATERDPAAEPVFARQSNRPPVYNIQGYGGDLPTRTQR
jgi:hypothetical protein